MWSNLEHLIKNAMIDNMESLWICGQMITTKLDICVTLHLINKLALTNRMLCSLEGV